MQHYSDTNKTIGKDQIVVALSLVGFFLCGLLLASDDLYMKFFGESKLQSQTPVIGAITFSKNDIRQRGEDSLSWEKTRTARSVRKGDSVFTGDDSSLQVKLNEGGKVDLDQNSLVKFTTINNFEVPNLALGNFRVTVSGKMRIAIAGKVTEIEGNGSELQVIVKENKAPKFRLLKGSAHYTVDGEKHDLVLNEIATNEQKPLEPVTPDQVFALDILDIGYAWKVDDFFEQKKSVWTSRKEPRGTLSVSVPVEWVTAGSPKKIYGQISTRPSFDNIVSTFTGFTRQRRANFDRAVIGENFFRLSVDGEKWTDYRRFNVVARYLPGEAEVRVPANRLYLLEPMLELKGSVVTGQAKQLLEIAHSPNFEPEYTEVVEMNSPQFRVNIRRPGTLYLRARGVSEDLRVTQASRVYRIDIEKPELPELPLLTKNFLQILEGETANLSWKGSGSAKFYRVQVVGSKNEILAEKTQTNSNFSYTPERPGAFSIRIYAIDRFRRATPGYASIDVSVAAKPEVVVPRGLAAAPAIKDKLESKVNYFDKLFSSSRLSFEGSAFTMFSKDQIESEKPKPTALLFGIRIMQWWQANGLEGLFRTKVADVASADGATVKPMQIEGRYKYRWRFAYNPFSRAKGAEIAAIAGYEYYRNSGTGLFSPGYKLLKTGFSLDFPLGLNWGIGGEALYGQGFDSSHKYEVSGHLNYFMEKNWSFGAGYRVHLFEAGSQSATPVELPYREGFGEGYTELRWHY